MSVYRNNSFDAFYVPRKGFELKPGALYVHGTDFHDEDNFRNPISLYANKNVNFYIPGDELLVGQIFLLVSAEKYKTVGHTIGIVGDANSWILQILVEEKIRWMIYKPRWHTIFPAGEKQTNVY